MSPSTFPTPVRDEELDPNETQRRICIIRIVRIIIENPYSIGGYIQRKRPIRTCSSNLTSTVNSPKSPFCTQMKSKLTDKIFKHICGKVWEPSRGK